MKAMMLVAWVKAWVKAPLSSSVERVNLIFLLMDFS